VWSSVSFPATFPREEQAKRELVAAGDGHLRATLLKHNQARAISLQIAPLHVRESKSESNA
jgi:hypothetical protein